MVKKAEDEEQEKQHQANSTISSSSASGPSKYFASPLLPKKIAKKSTENCRSRSVLYSVDHK